MPKTITIKKSVYDELFRFKKENESFSDLLDKRSSKGQSLLNKILESGEEYCTSSVNMHEVLYGIAKHSRVSSLVNQLQTLAYNRSDSELSAILEIDAERKGRSVPIMDAMVASIAINNGCSLYTLDEHFKVFTDRGRDLFR